MTEMKIDLSEEPQKEILKAINKINKRLDITEKLIENTLKNAPERPVINENKPSNDIALPKKEPEIQYQEPKWKLKLIVSCSIFIIITMALYYFFQSTFKPTNIKDILLFACASGFVGLIGAFIVYHVFNVNQKLKFYKMNYQQNEVPLMKEEIGYPARCPLCNSKLLKGTIQKENNKYAQILKCKNKNCTFQQEYNLTL